MRNLLLACTVALSVGFVGSARANLIVNGGFETGDFTGFTQGGNLQDVLVSPDYANSGAYGAELGPVGRDGTLSQTFATTIGDTYRLTYFHFYSGQTPNDFSALFGGVTFDATQNATGPTSYTQYADSIVASSSMTTLQFSFGDDQSFQGLDDISVLDTGPVGTPIPEPASLVLLSVGLLGIVTARRWTWTGARALAA